MPAHPPPDPATVERVAALLRSARRALFITGAGISAESGLPTYRGVGGLYEGAATEEGLPIEVALSGRTMALQPAITWKYLAQIESACRGARHNRAHEIIAAMGRTLEHTCVLTQNVDGFHTDAGSGNVIEIHGNLHDLACVSCDWAKRVSSYEGLSIPPACPSCGRTVRPRVVLFGEMLPMDALASLWAEMEEGFDVLFTIGTTSAFPYIAQPVVEAHVRGVPTVEINPGETAVSRLVDHRLATGARAALEAVWARLSPAAPGAEA